VSASLTAELQRILERWQSRGVRTVSLSPGVAEAYFRRSPKPLPTVSVAPPPPRPAPRPAAPPPPKAEPPPPPPVAAAPVVASSLPVEGMGWEELQAKVASCEACKLRQGCTQTVFGVGDIHARLMFIGEGPGFDEDQQGIPFVGKAGQLLTKMIQAMQFSRDEVYIANIVKCRPPNNRNPEPDEVLCCLPYLRRQIELVKPEVIVVLGAVPLRELLGGRSIMRERGEWRDYHGIAVMPTFHPSYLLRVPTAKRQAWDDLQQVMQRLGKDPAQTTPRR